MPGENIARHQLTQFKTCGTNQFKTCGNNKTGLLLSK